MTTKKQCKKKATKKSHKFNKFHISLYFIFGLLCLGLAGIGIGIKINSETGEIIINPVTYSEEQIPAIIEDDKGEVIEVEGIPTVEEVDGGLFEDKDTGLSTVEGEYEDLGWYETFNVSSPEAFKNDTLNKCLIANNKYGAQCVSLARVFWWSYADRDVTTCGTGMAKGMMECSEQNAGTEFVVFWSNDAYKIQAGDWLVFNGGRYGHVGMALGNVNKGYVALLGENQGGTACAEGGSATNIINISIKNLIGFYRPKAYIKPPKPTPVAPDTGIVK